MSLLRTGVLLACGIALMPADKAQQDKVFNQAAEAAGWASTYCAREPVKCEQAAGLWEAFKGKAAFAGRLALEASQTYAADAAVATPGDHNAPAQPEPAVWERKPAQGFKLASSAALVTGASRGTLSRDDLRPAWRAPAAR